MVACIWPQAPGPCLGWPDLAWALCSSSGGTYAARSSKGPSAPPPRPIRTGQTTKPSLALHATLACTASCLSAGPAHRSADPAARKAKARSHKLMASLRQAAEGELLLQTPRATTKTSLSSMACAEALKAQMQRAPFRPGSLASATALPLPEQDERSKIEGAALGRWSSLSPDGQLATYDTATDGVGGSMDIVCYSGGSAAVISGRYGRSYVEAWTASSRYHISLYAVHPEVCPAHCTSSIAASMQPPSCAQSLRCGRST